MATSTFGAQPAGFPKKSRFEPSRARRALTRSRRATYAPWSVNAEGSAMLRSRKFRFSDAAVAMPRR